MSEPTEVAVTIGGERIVLPQRMPIGMVERAWPGIEAFPGSATAVERAANLAIILAGVLRMVKPVLTVEEIKERMTLDEYAENVAQLDAILARMGLRWAPKPGEAEPAAERSTATGEN